MTNNQNKINFLLNRLEILQRKQNQFSKEIVLIKEDVYRLQQSVSAEETNENSPPQAEQNLLPKKVEVQPEPRTPQGLTILSSTTEPKQPIQSAQEKENSIKVVLNLEKFIGENLINKIGIAITVIGVAIGAKYSIEHELISPLTRIILGYFSGLALLGVGIKLKAKYENYSAVLVSGAMAILYFITYVGYSLYGLFPQLFAFVLMFFFTVFTVVAAINYNRVIIAQIGLVGAYFVPFLLSNNSGHVEILFSYMAIINVGILVIGFKRHWKSLFYSSFAITWLIYLSWYFTSYQISLHFGIALTFVTVFYLIFYATFLAYKIIRNEKLGIENIVLLLLNSFLFYGIGYSILVRHDTGEQFLGIFTLANAIVHFIVSRIIHIRKLGDKKFKHFILGLVLVFVTIAIPVQLEGNWVTLLWIGQAAILFWVGRSKNISIYELLSYPLLVLATLSLFHDFAFEYVIKYRSNDTESMKSLFNIHFASSVLFVLGVGFMIKIMRQFNTSISNKKALTDLAEIIIPGIFLGVIYYALRVEIDYYWTKLYYSSSIVPFDGGATIFDADIKRFKIIWGINFTMLYGFLLTLLNIKKEKNVRLGWVSIGINVVGIFTFLVFALFQLSELRVNFISPQNPDYFIPDTINIWLRYVSYIFAGGVIWATFQYTKQSFFKTKFRIIFDLAFHVIVVWILSSELLQWMDLADSSQQYKLGLSILFGSYSLLLISLGIWKRKQHLRILAFAIFGSTLIKLFFYDITHLTTIAKTIVFVSLGVLLLIISFLYNKFKINIADDTKE